MEADELTSNATEAGAESHTSLLPQTTEAGMAPSAAAAHGEPTDLTQKYPAGQPITKLDASDLRQLFRAAYDWLAHNHEQVNRLNVFPVPDGDTGTNMLLTIKSAWSNIANGDNRTVSDVADAAAEGAHQGSRGNSGVILGQILRGFSQSLRHKDGMTAQDLAEALHVGSEAAYDAVPAPVEGTILTVSREASEAAADAAKETKDLRTMLEHVVKEADRSVNRTPDQLPALKKAGVVDSGGKGFYFLLEGMYRALTGQEVRTATDATPVEDAEFERQARKGKRQLPEITWGFDVQFLVERPNKPVYQIAADIAAMGECPLVEGDERLVKVHVHVFDPGVPISYGVGTGFITDVVVENMDDMAAESRIGANDVSVPPVVDTVSPAGYHVDENQIGMVSVVPGAGFAEIFRNLGAHGIVEGGQSMNPSVAELTEAIRRLPTRRVVLLPNNRNILMAAQQAAKLLIKEHSPHQVVVIPSKTMPQGVAALTVFDPMAEDLDTLKKAMEEQMKSVQSGEVTMAVRTAEVDGIRVRQGDIIGLHNGKLVNHGDSIKEISLDLLDKMGASDGALVTIYYGNFVAAAAAEDFAETVRTEYPDLDVELAYGGQPHYHYILSVE